MFDFFGIAIVVLCGGLYYQVGEAEYQRGFLIAAVSVLLSATMLFVLHWEKLVVLAAQGGLFIVLTVFNILHRRAPR